jgi:hypothetical protein
MIPQPSFRLRTFAVGVILLLALALPDWASALTPVVTGGIGGRITSQSGGAGIASAGVNVYDASGSRIGGSGVDGSGNYTVSGLSAGSYYVWTYNGENYIDQLYQGHVCYDASSCAVTNGTPVVVTAGATTTIDFALAVGGQIAGRVTETGTSTGLAGVSISISNANGVIVANRQTDSTGAFVTQGLPPATYYVRTSNTPGYVDKVFDNRQCLACNPNIGTPIVVTAGAIQTANFALDRGGVVAGRITDANSAQPVSGNQWVDFFDAAGTFVGTSNWTDASGN